MLSGRGATICAVQLTPQHPPSSGACLRTSVARVAGQQQGVKAQFGTSSIPCINGIFDQLRAHTSLGGLSRHISSAGAIVDYGDKHEFSPWTYWIQQRKDISRACSVVEAVDTRAVGTKH